MTLCPRIEQYIVDADIILVKIWLEVGKEEQEKRFAARIDDPLRQWKLSPMDVLSYNRWYDYSKARDMMFKATDRTRAVVCHPFGRQAPRAAQLHFACAEGDTLQTPVAGEGHTAKAVDEGPLQRRC